MPGIRNPWARIRTSAAPCIAALLSAVLCPGCIELSQVLSIREDGSGSLELTYALPDNTSAQMKAIQELRKEMLKAAGKQYAPKPLDTHFSLFADPVDDAIRDLVKQHEPYGITLENLKIEVLEGRKRVRMVLRFSNLAKAAESDLFRLHWPVTLLKQTDGSYQLNLTNGRPGGEPNLDYTDAGTLKSITPILQDFKVTIRINPPGEIVRTSAPRTSAHSAVWTFNFSENPRAFSAFQAANMSVRFKGDGLALPEVRPAPIEE